MSEPRGCCKSASLSTHVGIRPAIWFRGLKAKANWEVRAQISTRSPGLATMCLMFGPKYSALTDIVTGSGRTFIGPSVSLGRDDSRETWAWLGWKTAVKE